MENVEFQHSGIKGMKWGVRRWQNEDGSLTEAGRAHYGIKQARMEARIEKAKLKRAKIEAKNAKSQSAYATGKKFGDAFIPAVGKALGENFGKGAGEMMGNIANPLKWKQSKTDRINAEAAKANAEAQRIDKSLSKKKYEEGFAAEQQKIDKTNAEAAKLKEQANMQQWLNQAVKTKQDIRKWEYEHNVSVRRKDPVYQETIKEFKDRIDGATSLLNNPYASQESRNAARGTIATIETLIKNDDILSTRITIPELPPEEHKQ